VKRAQYATPRSVKRARIPRRRLKVGIVVDAKPLIDLTTGPSPRVLLGFTLALASKHAEG
jgi:hypothetical protein